MPVRAHAQTRTPTHSLTKAHTRTHTLSHTAADIDYEMLVNAVRLRLHYMQEGFREKTDRDVYSRPKAKCTGCGRGYMDTEMV